VIALIDYGAGNLTSVRKALSTLGAEFVVPVSPLELESVRGIIVPGVGHFEATRALDHRWRDAIRGSLDRGGALFGICLGMQWLFEGSDESPDVPGFGALPGRCIRIPAAGRSVLKVPHVGWNSLQQPRETTIMRGVAPDAQVYFTHSYVAPVVAESAAITTYGMTFSAAVESARIAGVQFHPEKSGAVGLRILTNWLHAL
jgi:imidazole glycerol-phosphate synthase subunit HisH